MFKLCPDHEPWMPHISLVFREMWNPTALTWNRASLQELPVKIRGIPYLAKNERDMSHPGSIYLASSKASDRGAR